ncbi:MAG TPA: hypothetical protein VHQ43_01770 [Solirubrobacterales bacterium]|jgi:hypothetical protein|nr:hypothetical protein [Solirubrobacterales bacterium]
MDAGKENRPPRGALAVVAVGLLATLVAALLATDEPVGSAAELAWESQAPLPDSRPVAIPGGGSMQLFEAGVRATEANVSGYRVYRAAAVLKIDAGSAVGQGRVRCSTRVPGSALATHTPGSRADYPRSSSGESLTKQDVPEVVLVEFNSNGTELGVVELGDAFDTFVDEPGVVVSWSPYRKSVQGWQWGLPPGKPKLALELGFASFWRTSSSAAARIACSVKTGAGKASVRTAGELPEADRAGS